MEKVVLQVGNFRTWGLRFLIVLFGIVVSAFTVIYFISDYLTFEVQIILGNAMGIVVLLLLGVYIERSMAKPRGYFLVEFKEDSVTIHRKRKNMEFYYHDIVGVTYQSNSYGSTKNDIMRYSVYVKSPNKRYRIDAMAIGERSSFEETDLYVFYNILYAKWKNHHLKHLDRQYV